MNHAYSVFIVTMSLFFVTANLYIPKLGSVHAKSSTKSEQAMFDMLWLDADPYIGNAYLMVIASKYAYAPEKSANQYEKKLQKKGLRICPNGNLDYSDKVSDVEAKLFYTDKVVILAYQGSESARDWITTDANAVLVKASSTWGKNIRVHSGFYSGAYNSAKKWNLTGRVSRCMTDGKSKGNERKLFITGHSLGGALAYMAAYILELAKVRVHAVYTFGAPVTGGKNWDKAFSSRFHGRIQAYRAQGDLVPLSPDFGGYKGVSLGNVIHLGDEKSEQLWNTYKTHGMTRVYIPVIWAQLQTKAKKVGKSEWLYKFKGPSNMLKGLYDY